MVKIRLDEVIADTEKIECTLGNNKEYSQAVLYQNLNKVLRGIRTICGEEKPKGDKENE